MFTFIKNQTLILVIKIKKLCFLDLMLSNQCPININNESKRIYLTKISDICMMETPVRTFILYISFFLGSNNKTCDWCNSNRESYLCGNAVYSIRWDVTILSFDIILSVGLFIHYDYQTCYIGTIIVPLWVYLVCSVF